MRIAPPTQHRSQGDLPFVPGRPGVEFQLLQVDLAAELWVIRVRLQPGTRLERHRHTGEVIAFTLQGAWHYLEQAEVCTAGSYLYEPAGSEYQLEALPTNASVTDVWFAIRGANEHLDDAGRVVKIRDAAEILATYRAECSARGWHTPPVIGA